MDDEHYKRLAKALDTLPNGFPRTPAGTEMRLLRWIFTSDEAKLTSQLTRKLESVEVIAKRVGLNPEELSQRLEQMAKKRLVWKDRKDGSDRYRLAPFIYGIYEAQGKIMDHEFAHLFEKYMAEGGAAGIMIPDPAIHRVVPAHGAVKSELILPYDDVKNILSSAQSFRVHDCICRVQQDFMGRRCNFPLKVCISFSAAEYPVKPEDEVSKEEALAILNQTEELGLVHTVSNFINGVGYVCNCCSCCCGMLRSIIDWGLEKSVARANYYAFINTDECNGCGLCIERCQIHAISDIDGVAVVNREQCIGCGLCVTGCPNDAPELYRKPDSEIIHPPLDFQAWELERLKNRGLPE